MRVLLELKRCNYFGSGSSKKLRLRLRNIVEQNTRFRYLPVKLIGLTERVDLVALDHNLLGAVDLDHTERLGSLLLAVEGAAADEHLHVLTYTP